jgi:hypothetical protein
MSTRERQTRATFNALEQRWFAALLVYTLAPLAALLVYARPRAIDWWWDLAMACGVCAASGLALLPLLSARWWAPQYHTSGFLRLIQTTHRGLTYVALGLATAHAGLLWWLEHRVVEYLKLGATGEMLAGTLGLLLILFLLVSSLYREAWHWRYRYWRLGHAWISALTLSLILWHLLGAGYYYGTTGPQVMLVWLLCVPTMMTLVLRRWPHASSVQHSAGPGELARRSAQRLVLAVMLTWAAAAVGFAWAGRLQSPALERALCAVEPCL